MCHLQSQWPPMASDGDISLSNPQQNLANRENPLTSLFFTTLRHRVYDGFGGCKAAAADGRTDGGSTPTGGGLRGHRGRRGLRPDNIYSVGVR